MENLDKNSTKYILEEELANLEIISKEKDKIISKLEANVVDTQEKIDEVDNIFMDVERLQKQLEKKGRYYYSI